MSRRRDLLLLPLAAAAARGAKLPDLTLPAAKARLIREPFGDHRVYFEGSTGQLKAMTAGSLLLKPGASPHPPHTHDEEEFILIAEGSGEISIDGKPSPAAAGAIMYCAAGKLHGITNTGKTLLLFYYFKWKS
jgi:quercetin dioxygenase-like cupin family protein